MDHPRIASLVKENFSAEATRVKLLGETKKILESGDYDLTIINRIGALDQKSGIELIKELKSDINMKSPLMLVTNYDDQMELSIKCGGVQGFGKDNLFANETIELLKQYLS